MLAQDNLTPLHTSNDARPSTSKPGGLTVGMLRFTARSRDDAATMAEIVYVTDWMTYWAKLETNKNMYKTSLNKNFETVII